MGDRRMPWVSLARQPSWTSDLQVQRDTLHGKNNEVELDEVTQP